MGEHADKAEHELQPVPGVCAQPARFRLAGLIEEFKRLLPQPGGLVKIKVLLGLPGGEAAVPGGLGRVGSRPGGCFGASRVRSGGIGRVTGSLAVSVACSP